MELVNADVFATEVLDQEGLTLVFTSRPKELLRSYSRTYPKGLRDATPVARLYARLITLLPKGVWVLYKASGEAVQNRRALMSGLRNTA